MKLLIVNESGMYGGGAENRINLLIKKLTRVKKIREIHLISKKNLNIPKVLCHQITEKIAYLKIKTIIKEHKIDLIQVHNAFDFAVQAIKAAKKAGKPIIFFAHDYWGFCGRRNLMNHKNTVCSRFGFIKCSSCIGLVSVLKMLKIKEQINRCDVGIAPSKFVKNIYEKNGILPGKWKIIEPWIDLKLFKPNKKVKRDPKIMLFVGPLTYAKGADIAAEALKYIAQEIPDIKLKFIGHEQEKDSKDRKRIESIIKRNWTLQNIEFCGPKYGNELVKEYQKAGIYICCPVWPEIFGQTWAQAIACGCPVIATNVGSIPFLAPELDFIANDPFELAKKVIDNFQHPKPLAIKNKGFKKFALKSALAELKEVYLTLVDLSSC